MQSSLATQSLKTCPDGSRQKTTHSAVSSPDLWEQATPYHRQAEENGLMQVWSADPKGALPGAFSTLNFSDWPNAASVSSLSQILETEPIPPRYYLSPKACAGILRRAEKRGKALPEQLRQALQQVAGDSSGPATRAVKTA